MSTVNFPFRQIFCPERRGAGPQAPPHNGSVPSGILPEGTEVFPGMKAGDIDPRCQRSHCFTASDKALAVGGGVLEAILALTGARRETGIRHTGGEREEDHV